MNFTGQVSDYIVAFLSGVAVSFTPCLYPVMPITASILASVNVNKSKILGFLFSLVYVLGLAITYCSFAVIASFSGKIFGQVQNSPVVYFIVAAIFFIFGLIMLEVVPLRINLFSVQNKVKVNNIGAILFLGMIAGLVVGPCTAPILGSLLVYVAQKQNLLYSVSLLFVFSFGVGFSLILVGTFSNILANLPKSGRWMEIIKKICGFILLAISVYYLVKGIRLLN